MRTVPRPICFDIPQPCPQNVGVPGEGVPPAMERSVVTLEAVGWLDGYFATGRKEPAVRVVQGGRHVCWLSQSDVERALGILKELGAKE